MGCNFKIFFGKTFKILIFKIGNIALNFNSENKKIMDKKKSAFLVLGIFVLLAITIIVKSKTKSNFYKELQTATNEQFENIMFYKDYIRDDEGLETLISDEKDINDFISILKSIQPAGYTIKSLTVEVVYKVRFNFVENGKNKLITVEVYRTEQTGDDGVISIMKGNTGVTEIGMFSSPELLKWIEGMEQKHEYSNIGFYR